ncbi:MAG TPA: MlaD family protein [Candidatus Brocadiales bacterium]|nr:MlaD family protein [Candidatus Brocadiales bacterium]
MARSSEIKVGIFFIIGMVVLGILTFRIEHFSDLFKKQYRLNTKFSAAGGLQPGNPICLAGVKIGEIEKVKVVGEKVQVTMLINEGVVIREAAQATIVSDYLLGNAYVNLTLAPETSPTLEPDSFVRGVDLPGLTDMMTKLDSAIDGIRNITAPFEKGKETFESLTETVKSFKDVGPKLTQLIDTTQDIANQVKEGQGTLGKLFTDAKLYDDLTETVGSVKSLTKKIENGEGTFGKLFTDEGIYNDLKSVSADIKDLTSKMEKGEGTLGKLLTDTKLYDELTETISSMKVIAKNIEKGEGTMGKLFTDEEMYNSLKEAVADLKSIMDKMEKGEGTLAKLMTSDELYVELKKILQETKETMQGYKEQIPVGAFSSIVFSGF